MSVYSYINTRSSKGIVYIILVALLGLIMIGILILKNTLQYDENVLILLNIMLAMIAVQFVILFYNGFMKKINILPEGIRFQSPLSDYTIPWISIKSIGAYKVMKNAVEPIPFTELDKPIFFGSIWIYCSVLQHQQVTYRNKKNTTLVFPYRREILEEIRSYITIEKHIIA